LFKIERLSGDNFRDIPCGHCLYWQTFGPFNEKELKPEMMHRKREWFNKAIREFGNCGFIAYLDGVPIGFIQYALTRFFPRVKDYASGPSSEDAVFLTCLYISDENSRGRGLGTLMLEKLIAELRKRKFKAVETFARKNSENNPSGPLELYLKHNFEINNDRDEFPLVRFEL